MTEVKVKDPANDPLPWYRQLLAIKDTLIIIITPIILLPIPIAFASYKVIDQLLL